MSHLKKYANRPSPPYPANECRNKMMTGNDGNIYASIPDKRGRFTWKKSKVLRSRRGTFRRGTSESKFYIGSRKFNRSSTTKRTRPGRRRSPKRSRSRSRSRSQSRSPKRTQKTSKRPKRKSKRSQNTNRIRGKRGSKLLTLTSTMRGGKRRSNRRRSGRSLKRRMR